MGLEGRVSVGKNPRRQGRKLKVFSGIQTGRWQASNAGR